MNRFQTADTATTPITWWRVWLACVLMLGLMVSGFAQTQTVNLQNTEIDFSASYDPITLALTTEALRLESPHKQATSAVDDSDPPDNVFSAFSTASAQALRLSRFHDRQQTASHTAAYLLPVSRAPPTSSPA